MEEGKSPLEDMEGSVDAMVNRGKFNAVIVKVSIMLGICSIAFAIMYYLISYSEATFEDEIKLEELVKCKGVKVSECPFIEKDLSLLYPKIIRSREVHPKDQVLEVKGRAEGSCLIVRDGVIVSVGPRHDLEF